MWHIMVMKIDSADEVSDFLPANESLVFAVNATDGDSQCIDVVIREDNIFEGFEVFTVELNVITPGVETVTSESAIIITDSEG